MSEKTPADAAPTSDDEQSAPSIRALDAAYVITVYDATVEPICAAVLHGCSSQKNIVQTVDSINDKAKSQHGKAKRPITVLEPPATESASA